MWPIACRRFLAGMLAWGLMATGSWADQDVGETLLTPGKIAEGFEPLFATLALRAFTNRETFEDSPYGIALVESTWRYDEVSARYGFEVQAQRHHLKLDINHLFFSFLQDATYLEVGKRVATSGVLDFLSTVDVLTPTRSRFFDDPNLNIRKIPLWGLEAGWFVNDTVTLKGYLQPYDSRYQDYAGVYLGFLLSTVLPEYALRYFSDDQIAGEIGRQIFLPVYDRQIAPALSGHIQGVSDSQERFKMRNPLGGIELKWLGDYANVGFLWFNRYSEIPYAVVNQDLIDSVRTAQLPPTPSWPD